MSIITTRHQLKAGLYISILVVFMFAGMAIAEVPPDPVNIQNTTGHYWVNHTWQPGGDDAGDTLYLIAGKGDGTFDGYNGTGATW